MPDLFPIAQAIEAELHAVWRGVHEIEELGSVGAILEGDSKVILGWASSSRCFWRFLDKVKRNRHSISKFGFAMSWVPRGANSAADEKASRGISISSEICKQSSTFFNALISNSIFSC